MNSLVKALSFMWFACISVACLNAIYPMAAETKSEITYVEPLKKEFSSNIIIISDDIDEASVPDTKVCFVEDKPDTVTTPEYSYSIGDYTITGYCCCEKCCGNWSKSNKTNDGIIGARGTVLKEGVSVAAWLPLGTEIRVNGEKYVVEDRTSQWIKDKYNSKIIDVYFKDHDEALNFGKHIAKVYIIK